jgi:hypothetical protein
MKESLEIKEKIEEDVKEKNASQNNEEKISLKSSSSEISTSSLLSTSTMSEEDFSCLVINEFLPNPDGRDENREFIELYNECDKKLNLDGLTLKVGRFKLKLSGEIKEREFKVLRNSDYRFYIRNSGEEISLLKDKETLYKISYSGKAPEGLSFSRNEEEWFWTLPTPGRENEKESYQENNLKVEESKEVKVNKSSKEEIETNDFDKSILNEGKAEIYSSEPKIIQIFLPLVFITLIALVFTILFKI